MTVMGSMQKVARSSNFKDMSGHKTHAGPLADSHEIKGFYKGYFRQNKGYFIEILTKIKSKSKSNF